MPTHRLLVPTVIAAVAASVLAPAASEAAPSQRARDSFTVTIEVDKTEPVYGQKVVITGKVRPASQGAPVVLQKRTEGSDWKKEEAGSLRADGTYRFTDQPSTMVARDYRVIRPATKQRARGVSPKVHVTVYQWHFLTSLPVRASSGIPYYHSFGMDGTDYTEGYYAPLDAAHSTASIDWNIDHACTQLQATYGMNDQAEIDDSARIDVIADGVATETQTVTLFDSVTKTTDIRDVFRIGFDYTTLSTQSQPGVGDPQVLCSF